MGVQAKKASGGKLRDPEANGEPGASLPGKAPALYGEEFPKVYQTEHSGTTNRAQVACLPRKNRPIAPNGSTTSPPSERERVARLQELTRGRFPQLATGIGDDAAVVRLAAGEQVVVTTDMLLEGVHFRRDWHTARSAGHRCLARGLSDVAAMGARPLAAFLSVAFPPELAGTWADDFFAGLLALAREHHIPLAGGDLAQSSGALTADITVLGRVPAGAALLRSPARAGDALYVTGSLGGAAAGLGLLGQCGAPARGETNLLQSQLFPEPRVRAGLALRRLAQRGLRIACMDISDGLALDLHRLCTASGTGAELQLAALPIVKGATLEQALHGGEDYELLFTAPAGTRVARALAGVPVTRIGRLTRRRSVTAIAANGAEAELQPRGWEYFSDQQRSPAPF